MERHGLVASILGIIAASALGVAALMWNQPDPRPVCFALVVAALSIVALLPQLALVVLGYLPFRWRTKIPRRFKTWPEIAFVGMTHGRIRESDQGTLSARYWIEAATFVNAGRAVASDVSARLAFFRWPDGSHVDFRRHHLEGLWFSEREVSTDQITYHHEVNFNPNGLPWNLELVLKPLGEGFCFAVDRHTIDDIYPGDRLVDTDPFVIGVLLSSADLREDQQFLFKVERSGDKRPVVAEMTAEDFAAMNREFRGAVAAQRRELERVSKLIT